MSEGLRDRRCLERVGAGDVAALAELHDRYGELLHSLVRRMVPERSAAEDALHATWLRVWREARRYDPARASVGAWLVLTARECVRERRDDSRTDQGAAPEPAAAAVAPEPAADPASDYAQRMLAREATAALASLSEPQRRALESALFAGASPAAIAAQLGTAPEAVNGGLRSALQRLSERMPVEELP